MSHARAAQAYGVTAIVFWVAATFAAALNIHDRLPAVVAVLCMAVAIAAGDRWGKLKMQDELSGRQDELLADLRADIMATLDAVSARAGAVHNGPVPANLPEGVAAKIYDLGRRHPDREA